MEENKYTIQEIVELLNSVDGLKGKAKKLSIEKAELENQLETKYSDDKYILVEKDTLRNLVCSLESSVDNMDSVEDNIGNIENYVSDAQYSLSDARSDTDCCIDDINTIIDSDDE